MWVAADANSGSLSLRFLNLSFGEKIMIKLECMKNHCDGAHCGLADWYSDIEQGIVQALNQGPEFEWTTGWYSSKKEIANCCIANAQDGITIKVSVSDDFDTVGKSEKVIQHTTDLDVIRRTIYEVWDEASSDQEDNREYVGYSIFTEIETHSMYIGGVPQGKPVKTQGWVETYLKPNPNKSNDDFYFGFECELDGPPGDCYEDWGFQNEYEIPDDIKTQLAQWAESNEDGEFSIGGFTIKPWKD